MDKSESIKNLAEALAKAQGEMPAAKMNAVNPFLKNRYADLGSIIETAKPVLARHGLSVSQMIFTDERTDIGVESILMHASGEWISSKIALQTGDEKGKSQAQAAGSTITYLRRYALSALLGMYADEDTDGGKAQQPASQPAQQKEQSAQSKTMTLADAENTLSDKGVRYGERPTDELAHVANNPKSPADKKQAAQMILAERAKKASK